jgi:hypothetical protein
VSTVETYSEKGTLKNRLFRIGVETLEKNGWAVERVQGSGKSSLRKITKAGKSLIVTIRTTQDTWIAFPRKNDDSGWVTLSDVDAVVAVSVDDAREPRFAKVHIIGGDDMRERFDRAYAARLQAGHKIPVGRGVWLALYLPEANEPKVHVGAGAGLKHPAIATVPLEPEFLTKLKSAAASEPQAAPQDEAPLTIAEAKRRLALSLGVDPSNIRITVEA